MTNREEVAKNEGLTRELQMLLEANKDKRVVVVGTTCTGKSTLIKSIPNAHDMDALIFPKLSTEEKEYVCQKPWTEEIGRTMDRLAKERVVVQAGEPVFGTIVFNSDLIINLVISDELLKKRVAFRGLLFTDAKNMQRQIEKNIRQSGIQKIDFPVG